MVGELPEGCLYIAVKVALFRDSQGKYDLLSIGADKEALYKRDPSTALYKENDETYLKHKDGVWLIYCTKPRFCTSTFPRDYYRLSSKGQLYKGEFMIQ